MNIYTSDLHKLRENRVRRDPQWLFCPPLGTLGSICCAVQVGGMRTSPCVPCVLYVPCAHGVGHSGSVERWKWVWRDGNGCAEADTSPLLSLP